MQDLCRHSVISAKTVWKGAAIVLPVIVLGYFVFNAVVLSPNRQLGGSGSALLSWTPPTERVNGSPLTDLTGYIIRYSTDPTRLSRKVHVDNPETTHYTIEDLPPGTYYFSVSAVTASGSESKLSNMVSKTIK